MGEVVTERSFTPMKFFLFAVVGAFSGVVYVLVYVLLRNLWSPALANLGAMIVSVYVNTEANRRWTFNRASVARAGMHVRSTILFLGTYAFTTVPVVVLDAVKPDAGRPAEVAVLIAADVLVTLLRFIGLDRWVFRQS